MSLLARLLLLLALLGGISPAWAAPVRGSPRQSAVPRLEGARARARLDHFATRYGLEARHALEVPGAHYTFTDLVDMGGGRLTALALVRTAGTERLAVFYRSKSQGLFRLLPALNRATRASGEDWFDGLPGLDKADGEDRLTAAPEVQMKLAGLLRAGAVHAQLSADRVLDEIVSRAVPVYRTPAQYDRYAESDAYPSTPARKIWVRAREGRQRISPTLRPDYRAPLGSYRAWSALDGPVEVRTYPSKDRSLVWSVMLDRAGLAHPVHVMARDAGVSPFGLPALAIDAGDALMPRWEYPFQIPEGYAGRPHPTDDTYATAWRWLRLRPEVRDFYRAAGQAVPVDR